MGPGAAILDLAIDGANVIRDDARRDGARLVDIGRIDLGRGFNGDGVARINGQYRFERGIEITKMNGLRTRHQRVLGGRCAARRKSD